MGGDGYERVITLSKERPEMIPLVRFIFDMGEQEFTDGLRELVTRGIITAEVLPEARVA